MLVLRLPRGTKNRTGAGGAFKWYIPRTSRGSAPFHLPPSATLTVLRPTYFSDHGSIVAVFNEHVSTIQLIAVCISRSGYEASWVLKARKTNNKRAKASTTPSDAAKDGEGTQPSSGKEEGEKTDTAQPEGTASGAVSRTSSMTFTARCAVRLEEKYGDLTTQESLDARAAKWTSHVYKHFRVPVLAMTKNGSITSRFMCIRNPSVHVDRKLTDESTSNLNRHINVCVPPTALNATQITGYAQGVNYSYARVRYLLAMWIARRHRPFTIVEDLEFCELLHMLYARVEIPSRVTISRDLKDIFEDSCARVKTKLQSVPGKIHICMDGWTSPNVISYLGVTAHWHEQGQIQHIILDFIKLTKGHTGAYLAAKLMALLEEFGIVLGVTCDNASNNSKMLKEMKKLDPSFRGLDARVHCFGHVINLVVKAILSQFGHKVKSESIGEMDKDLSALDDLDDDEEDEEDDADAAHEAADDVEIDKDEDDETRPELVVTEAEQKLGRLTLQKILKLSQKVWNSPTVREEMSSQVKAAGKNSEVLIRAVKTRWNTVTMAKFNKSQGVRLRRFIIEDEDWRILEELHTLLATFLEAMTVISRSSMPLLHDIIPWIDVMTHHLEDTYDNVNLLPVIRSAAHKGYKILQKYYRHMDETPFYRVAILLHPCYKKRYFTCARWPRDWVEKSLRLI
ncbi:hypothetical protein GSI_10392 [Ganoderma sinense ZZ0214-1]|uniref:DUF659 domain-containing protein n=1 Tax=Ganoderma sinense ZZ0214-1 TaxID=1077348 RepID=A0A2G8S119_9APHY|nr:hypothetical protein GSI_10392 [Ganoderma sinense ZZ0214-1]